MLERMIYNSGKGIKMDTQLEKRLVKVAKMYYEEDMIQSEIAKKMGVSRSLIAKYLTDAKKLGMIELVVKNPNNYTASLELELEKKYGLKNATVVDTKGYSKDIIAKVVSQHGADYFKSNIKNYNKIGISWGRSLRGFIDEMPFLNHPDLIVYSLLGGLSETNIDVQSNQLAQDLARKMRGTSQYLYAPALVSNGPIKKELMNNTAIKSVIEKSKKVDIALIGITSVDGNINLKQTGYINDDDIKSLKEDGVIGVINSRFFNEKGEEVDHYVNNSAVGLNLKAIKNIPEIMTIVYGDAKVPAIEVALKNNLINIIVTTDTIAEKLLSM